jgi:hypothetical protein
MAVICPICGAENPDSAEYCNLCLGSMGFFGSDVPVKDDHNAYLDKYPSSFSADAPAPAGDTGAATPTASPADVGEYGVASGYDYDLSVVAGLEKDSKRTQPKTAVDKKFHRAV